MHRVPVKGFQPFLQKNLFGSLAYAVLRLDRPYSGSTKHAEKGANSCPERSTDFVNLPRSPCVYVLVSVPRLLFYASILLLQCTQR